MIFHSATRVCYALQTSVAPADWMEALGGRKRSSTRNMGRDAGSRRKLKLGAVKVMAMAGPKKNPQRGTSKINLMHMAGNGQWRAFTTEQEKEMRSIMHEGWCVCFMSTIVTVIWRCM